MRSAIWIVGDLSTMKHLKTLYDLTDSEIQELLALSIELKGEVRQGRRPQLFQQRMVTLVFEKPSLRTRVSFEAAAAQLGGSSVFLSSADAGLNGRESLQDVARVLSSYSDVIVLRTFSQQLIEDFAEASACPVVNGLSDERHPCQSLSDIMTIREALPDKPAAHVTYIGDGNNVACSLAVLTARLGMPLTVCSPVGYELPSAFVQDLQTRVPGARLTQTSDPREAVKTADVVYTDVWASMGQEQESSQRSDIFRPYQVNAELMRQAPKDCRFLHCLPAHRGEEVTEEVVEGPMSLVFEQAANRLHVARGLLAWLTRQAD